MKGILVVAFWCWFAVSLGILFRRAVHRVSGGSAGRAAAPSTTTPLPLVPPVPDASSATDATPEPASNRGTGTLFVRDRATSSTNGSTAVRTVTIADALQGIRMPCELTPLTGNGNDFERRAAFVTVGYPAAVVAPEVADEIERIGMTFNALSDTTAIAERDDVRVKVAVRSVGAAVNGVPDPDFPTAPEHSVVVEFELA